MRIIAASHKDLREEAEAGRFREDLYHRLVVFELKLPPLRDRSGDIRPLVERFLSSRCPWRAGRKHWQMKRKPCSVSKPGLVNIRELRNEVERAWLRARKRGSSVLDPEDFHLRAGLPKSPDEFAGYGLLSLEDVQRLHVQHVLDACDGKRQRCAEILGVSERHVYRLLKRAADSAESDVIIAP